MFFLLKIEGSGYQQAVQIHRRLHWMQLCTCQWFPQEGSGILTGFVIFTPTFGQGFHPGVQSCNQIPPTWGNSIENLKKNQTKIIKVTWLNLGSNLHNYSSVTKWEKMVQEIMLTARLIVFAVYMFI